MKTSFNSSDNLEFSGIVKEVINVTDGYGNQEISNHMLFVEVKKQFPPYEDVLKRDAFTGLGDNVRQLNNVRMSSASSVIFIIKGFTKLSSPKKKEAAKAIIAELDQLGAPSKNRDYDVVNGYMSKFLRILESDTMKAHIATLGLEEEVAQVASDEKTFREVFMNQEVGNANLRQTDNATQLRPALAKALGNYLKYIKVMRSAPGYESLYNQLNEVVKTAKKDGDDSKEEEKK